MFVPAAPAGAQRAEELFKIGAEQQERGAVAAAERTYERAVAADPAHYGANHNLGDLRLRTGRLPQALEAYRRALATRPAETELRRKVAAILVAFGRGAEAVPDAERVVAEADSASSRMLLGRALLTAGRTNDACREMVRALAFNSRDSEVQLDLARCFIAADDMDAAFMHANAVALREPRNAAAAEIVASISNQKRADRWGWLPTLVALGALFAAIGARGRDRRAQRWAALGVLVGSLASFGWLATNSRFWIAGWALAAYPFYAAVRFGRRPPGDAGDARSSVVIAAGRMLGCLARSGGAATPSTLRAARASCEWLGFSRAELALAGSAMQQCIAEIESALVEHEAISTRLHAVCGHLAAHGDYPTRVEFYRAAVQVALSDGNVTTARRSAVGAIAAGLAVPHAVQEHIWTECAVTTPAPEVAGSPRPPESRA